MDAKRILRSDRVTRIVFFLGFVGLIGWLGSSWFFYHICQWNDGWRLMDPSPVESLNNPPTLNLLGYSLLHCCFFLVLILPVMMIGRPRLKPCLHDRSLLTKTLAVAILLSPVYVILGTLLVLSLTSVGGQ